MDKTHAILLGHDGKDERTVVHSERWDQEEKRDRYPSLTADRNEFHSPFDVKRFLRKRKDNNNMGP